MIPTWKWSPINFRNGRVFRHGIITSLLQRLRSLSWIESVQFMWFLALVSSNRLCVYFYIFNIIIKTHHQKRSTRPAGRALTKNKILQQRLGSARPLQVLHDVPPFCTRNAAVRKTYSAHQATTSDGQTGPTLIIKKNLAKLKRVGSEKQAKG